ncbi:SurA N-terminal domain-containing protein [Tepidiforma flava]|uniref:peptidylprolyl isomerase n=1 Tax=Tepidiforma flava TaxID=3004094 RepID=A0ABY7M4B7_9CHLR|nr:peptidyl-prolyl cis-trans isomerase [Tepidiforma flava]WBL34828.1 SurA N-terminal domain-containing protein [Tepidiforma flava]
MARRERTTALPRQRPREARPGARGFFLTTEETLRLLILGGASLLLVIVLGLLGWRWYDQNFRVPEKVILQVGDERFKLSYYADRLFPYAQSVASSGINLSLAEQQLLTELENEAIVNAIARERGITVTPEDVTSEIASQLGVPAGGAGTTFDTLYRQRLQSLTMSDANYRRWVEAQVYRKKLKDAILADIGDTTEMVTLRTIITTTEDEAKAALARIQAGEDMGTVAQTASKDLNSRQKDGIMDPEPPALLPAAVQAAIEGKPAGSEVIGPVQLANGDWWILRIEKRDPNATPSDTQKSQLADLRIDELIKEKRAAITIRRNITSSDFRWAEEHAN